MSLAIQTPRIPVNPAAALRFIPLLLLVAVTTRAQIVRQPDAAASLVDLRTVLTPAPDYLVSEDVAARVSAVQAMYLNTDALAGLRRSASLLLRGLNLPQAGSVDLRVESFSVFTEQSVLVEATAAGDVRRPLPDVTFYRGHIPGEIGSWVFLAVESRSLSGTVTRGDGSVYSINPVQSASLQSKAAAVSVYLNTPEMLHFGCGVTEVEEWDAVIRRGFPEASTATVDVDTLFAGVAIDADFESFQHYGGTDPTAAYISARFAESTAIYERDLTIRLHIPFMRIWSGKDPFQGSSDSQLLNVFGTYWEQNMDSVKRSLATMISRKPISANGVTQGLAWVDQLCSKRRGYSFVKFSGNNGFATGHTMVLAHELGHNFGSMHTHSCTWNPPIDSCYNAEPIRNQAPCFSRSDIHLIKGGGELMSYCHLSFGNKNTNLVFRDRTGPLVRSRAEAASCLDVRSSAYILNMVAPTGGESVCAGSAVTITWEGSGLNTVAIYLSRNSGATYDTLLVSGLNRTIKSWNWNIPNDFTPGATYRFKIRDEVNDTLISAMNADLEIKPGTFIVRQVTWRNVCVGEGANFNVTASGTGTLQFQWKRNGIDIPGATSPTLQLQNMQLTDDSSIYTCVVTGDCGSVESEPALLKVFSVPKILQHPANDTLCIGATAVFTIQADGPELHYRWFTLGKIFDVDSATFTVPNIQASDANTCYYCEVTSPCGKINTKSGCIIIPNATFDKFLTPTPFQQLTAAGRFDIRWLFYCAPGSKLEYTLDGGQSYTTISASLPDTTLNYMWDVPSTETTNGHFRISEVGNASRSKISPTFHIRKRPVIGYSDNAVNFGRLPVNALTTKSVSFFNTGLGDLQVTRTDLVGSSGSTLTNGAPFTVSPGGSHDITVETTPAAAGPLAGYVLVEHNAAGSPDTLALVGDAFVVLSADRLPAPSVLMLHQNYPNPVSLSSGRETHVSFDVPSAGHVRLSIHNLLGKKVSTLVNRTVEAGRHDLRIDISSFTAGTYIIQMAASGRSISRVMHVIR